MFIISAACYSGCTLLKVLINLCVCPYPKCYLYEMFVTKSVLYLRVSYLKYLLSEVFINQAFIIPDIVIQGVRYLRCTLSKEALIIHGAHDPSSSLS